MLHKWPRNSPTLRRFTAVEHIKARCMDLTHLGTNARYAGTTYRGAAPRAANGTSKYGGRSHYT